MVAITNENSTKDRAVLLVTPFFRPNIGGVETRLDEVTKSLVRAGVEVTVITFCPLTYSAGKAEATEIDGSLRIFRHRWFGFDLFHKFLNYPVLEVLYLVPPLIWHVSWFFLTDAKAKKYKVVHAAGLNSMIACALVKLIFRFKLVVSTHAIYSFNGRSVFAQIFKIFAKPVDLILAIGEKSKKEICDLGIDQDKVVIQPTWVNRAVFKPLDNQVSRKALGLPDKFILGYVGRLNKIKGVRLIIELAKQFSNDSSVLFAMAGVGELEDEVKAASKNLPNLIYLGYLENYRLPEVYNSFDVTLIPSQYEEGFSRTAVESIACGIPVMASNRGCLPEIVREEIGWCTEPSEETFFKLLKEIMSAKTVLRTKSDLCLKEAEAKYSEKSSVSFLLSCYGFES